MNTSLSDSAATIMKNHLILLAAIIAFVPCGRATTVIPPTFDELVDQAQVIFQGKVTEVRSQWTGEGAQRYIVSYVTFRVEESLKGIQDKPTRFECSAAPSMMSQWGQATRLYSFPETRTLFSCRTMAPNLFRWSVLCMAASIFNVINPAGNLS